jgi:hypothetical protein
MPTTRQIVSQIKEDYAQNIGRSRILTYLDRVQNELVSQDCGQNIFLNGSDDSFPYPFLNTTSGTLSYEITAANLKNSDGAGVALTVNGVTVAIRKVKRIFHAVSTLAAQNYDRRFIGDAFGLVGINQYWSKKFIHTTFYEVPCRPIDKTDNQAAKVIFAEDPGTQAAMYYVEAYFEAPALSSEDVKLVIDSNKWMGAIIDGVVGYIEDVENGQSQRLEKFRSVWMREYRRDMNEGNENWRPKRIPYRYNG